MSETSNHFPSQAEFESLLLDSGAILRGHFLLSSGRHSDTYVEKFRILEKPGLTEQLCANIIEQLSSRDFEYVVGPATGGMLLAFEFARQLGIEARYVETVRGEKLIRRGATLPVGAKVLVVDDVMTTGLSIREVLGVLKQWGVSVQAIATMVDRSDAPLDFGIVHLSACRVQARSFAESDLPEDLRLIPITKPGTRV